MGIVTTIEESVGRALGSVLPSGAARAVIARLGQRNPQAILEGFGPVLNRQRDLDSMPFDLPRQQPVQFEDLAGLFASTSLDHAVASMPVRQAAYIFGLVRRLGAERVIEIGRYKGGSTLLIAAAMAGKGQFWSIDIGQKEARLQRQVHRPYDVQIADTCARLGLKVQLIVGDSRTVQVDTGEVDLVFIDGDHSYEGARIDFERFGTRVRKGGAVLFDDAFDEGVFRTHSDTVGRLVEEIASSGTFRLIQHVNRLAHLERLQ